MDTGRFTIDPRPIDLHNGIRWSVRIPAVVRHGERADDTRETAFADRPSRQDSRTA